MPPAGLAADDPRLISIQVYQAIPTLLSLTADHSHD